MTDHHPNDPTRPGPYGPNAAPPAFGPPTGHGPWSGGTSSAGGPGHPGGAPPFPGGGPPYPAGGPPYPAAGAPYPSGGPASPGGPPPQGYPPGWVTGPGPNGSARPSGRSTGRIVAAVVGVVAIAAAAVFAVTRIGGGSSAAGGADSPEAAGQLLLDAIENEDALGIIDVLLPGERETFYDPARNAADELRRLQVLSDNASLSDVGGIDIAITDSRIDVNPTNVADIVQIHLAGDVTASLDGEQLPIGELITDNFPDFDPSQVDAEPTQTQLDATLAAVERDGRWYVSAFYSAAEAARGIEDIPETGIAPAGGDSPEAAFDAFLDATERLDLSRMIGALNPNEFEALQRYAPIFLDDAQEEINAVGLDISFGDAAYSVSGSGDTRSITLTSLSGSLTADGQTATFEWADGCLTAQVPDEQPFDSCDLTSGAMDQLAEESPAMTDLVQQVSDSLADFDNPGIIVKRVDGEWYLSPLATGSEFGLEFLRALDRDEIETIGERVSDVISELDFGG